MSKSTSFFRKRAFKGGNTSLISERVSTSLATALFSIHNVYCVTFRASKTLASPADILRRSFPTNGTSGEGTRDARLRMSAGEASKTRDAFFSFLPIKDCPFTLL